MGMSTVEQMMNEEKKIKSNSNGESERGSEIKRKR